MRNASFNLLKIITDAAQRSAVTSWPPPQPARTNYQVLPINRVRLQRHQIEDGILALSLYISYAPFSVFPFLLRQLRKVIAGLRI